MPISLSMPVPLGAARLLSALALLAAATGGPALAHADAANGKAHAHHAHQHGLGKLDAVLEGTTLSLQLEVPLDSLLGFERRPRTDAERQALAAVLAQLRNGQALWQLPAAAQCRFDGVQLESVLLNDAAPGAREDEHLDLDAAYTFRCEQPAQLRQLGHGLFQAFPRLQQLQVQVAGPAGQSRQVLKRPQAQIRLAR